MTIDLQHGGTEAGQKSPESCRRRATYASIDNLRPERERNSGVLLSEEVCRWALYGVAKDFGPLLWPHSPSRPSIFCVLWHGP